jgi:hypothetical protein
VPELWADMTHLGDLARTMKYEASRVYRCYSCDTVFSEPR